MAARIVFLGLLISHGSLAQWPEAEKKMQEIDSFKKYTIARTDGKTLTEMNRAQGDCTIRVTALVNFTRKKSAMGKVVQHSRYQGTEVRRTCYINEDAKLFAIRDSIWYDNHTTRQLNYYFKGGTLEGAIDSNQKNVTGNINQTELFHWIASIFDDIVIE